MSQIDFEKHVLTGVEEYILRAKQSIPAVEKIWINWTNPDTTTARVESQTFKPRGFVQFIPINASPAMPYF